VKRLQRHYWFWPSVDPLTSRGQNVTCEFLVDEEFWWCVYGHTILCDLWLTLWPPEIKMWPFANLVSLKRNWGALKITLFILTSGWTLDLQRSKCDFLQIWCCWKGTGGAFLVTLLFLNSGWPLDLQRSNTVQNVFDSWLTVLFTSNTSYTSITLDTPVLL